MTLFQDIRYLRIEVDDLDEPQQFAGDVFGLQYAERTDSRIMFRSDARNYSLCFSMAGDGDAIAFSVAHEEDLSQLYEKLKELGYEPHRLDDAGAELRQAKAIVAVEAPNGVIVELVWRPLTSGWRFFGARDAGITDFSGVQLSCTDIKSNEHFWTKGLGLKISDWIGEAIFLALDDAHHRVALYPSKEDGILGATWAVESKDRLMINWYSLQKDQVEIVAGPDRQAASQAIYLSARGPRGLVMSYCTEMDESSHIAIRGPRQFQDAPRSHGLWGAPTKLPEFLGGMEK